MAHVLSACAGLIAFVAAQLDARPPEALGVLAVAPPPGPESDLVEDALALRQDIAGRRAGVLDGDRLRSRMTGPPAASLAELDLAFERARAAYLAGDHEGSVRALRGIVDDLERLPESSEALRQWTRAVLRLAKSETDLGRPDVARALLERLVRAVPDVQVDSEVYPARFLQQVEQARAGVRAEPTRVLRVSASADGATVYLNGRDVGPAPVELVVPRGRHRVGGELGAARVRPVPVDLEDGDHAIVLDFSVPEALRPALGPGLAVPDADRTRMIAASGSYLGLSELVAVGHQTDRDTRFLVGALYDVRRGILIREGRVRKGSAGGVEALAEFLVTGSATAEVERLDEKGRPVSAPNPGQLRADRWVANVSGGAVWLETELRPSADLAFETLRPEAGFLSGVSFLYQVSWVSWTHHDTYATLPGEAPGEMDQDASFLTGQFGLKRYVALGKSAQLYLGASGGFLVQNADRIRVGLVGQPFVGLAFTLGRARAGLELRYGAYGYWAKQVEFNPFGDASTTYEMRFVGGPAVAAVFSPFSW